MLDNADWSHVWTWWISGPILICFSFIAGAVLWVAYSKIRDRKRGHTVGEIVKKKEQGLLQAGSQSSLTGFREKNFTMDISFKKMGLRLRSNGRLVLQNVSGMVAHGRMTAVMGPSGSGKTTFMTTLAGRAYYGRMQGNIYVNGKKDRITNYKNLTGFVPQEDVMHRELTVEENLKFSAYSRLPSSMSQEAKMELVNNVLDLLDLSHLRYSQIGDEDVRGISGGQRKRVNIGIELVADPTLLFLDEPTSGLDSSSTMSICITFPFFSCYLAVTSALRTISGLGLTIVAVVHQPRYEVFRMFHDVVLLGNGGRTVYCGPTEEALAYFEGLGFECPEHCNPADFFLDIISGQIARTDGTTLAPEDLPRLWSESHPETTMQEDLAVGSADTGVFLDGDLTPAAVSELEDATPSTYQGYQAFGESESAIIEDDEMSVTSYADSVIADTVISSLDSSEYPIGLLELGELALKFVPAALVEVLRKQAHRSGYEELPNGTEPAEEATGHEGEGDEEERMGEESMLVHHRDEKDEAKEGSWITFGIWAVCTFLVFLLLPFAVCPGKPSKRRVYGAVMGVLVLFDLLFFSYGIVMLTNLGSGAFGTWLCAIVLYYLLPFGICIYCTIAMGIDVYRKDLHHITYLPQVIGASFFSIFYVWYMWGRKKVTITKRLAALAGFIVNGWAIMIIVAMSLNMGSSGSSQGIFALWPETLGMGLAWGIVTFLLLRRAHILPGDVLLQKALRQERKAAKDLAKKLELEEQKRKRLEKEREARAELKNKANRFKVGHIRQIPLFMVRSLLQYTRHWLSTVFDLWLVISAGLFAGIIYYQVYYEASPFANTSEFDDLCDGLDSTPCLMMSMPQQDPFPGQASITCLGLALAAVASSMRIFGDELVIFRRESEAGLSTEAYYIGKSLAHIPTEVLAPFMFTMFFYAIALPLAPFFQYFMLFYLIYATCTGLAYFVSLVTPQSLSQLAGVLTILSFMMFSGAAPTLEQLEENLLFPYVLYWCSYFSLFRWTQELYYIIAVRPYSPGPGGTLAYYGYEMSDEAMCWVAIVLLLITFRVLAYIALVVREKRR